MDFMAFSIHPTLDFFSPPSNEEGASYSNLFAVALVFLGTLTLVLTTMIMSCVDFMGVQSNDQNMGALSCCFIHTDDYTKLLVGFL